MSLFLTLAAAIAPAQADIPARDEVQYAVARLDLWSFPNSMRDRLRAAGPQIRTFRQLGPQRFAWRGGALEVWEADGSWVRRFRPLKSRSGFLRLCFVDQAQNGGTYLARQPIELRPAADGLYRARIVAGRRCRS